MWSRPTPDRDQDFIKVEGKRGGIVYTVEVMMRVFCSRLTMTGVRILYRYKG
jgi:hypothetical protein